MNLMLDFETLGTSPETIVLSLGAVLFDEKNILKEFYCEFDLQNQIDIKRTMSASTFKWWLSQDKDAQAVFKEGTVKLLIQDFFIKFNDFLNITPRNKLIAWGNGANFDVAIIEDIYRRYNSIGEDSIPWKFWNVMCYRTFNKLTDCKKLIEFKGVKHNALDDARYQVQTILAYWMARG